MLTDNGKNFKFGPNHARKRKFKYLLKFHQLIQITPWNYGITPLTEIEVATHRNSRL